MRARKPIVQVGRAGGNPVPVGFYVLDRTAGTCPLSLPAGTKLRKALASGLCISGGQPRHRIQVVEVYKVDGRLKCRVWKEFVKGEKEGTRPA